MNMFLQNITKFVTSVCYDVAIKQKLTNSKPHETAERKVVGFKVF